jgi:hypothetical protein
MLKTFVQATRTSRPIGFSQGSRVRMQVRRGVVERALAGLLNSASAGEEARGSLVNRVQE